MTGEQLLGWMQDLFGVYQQLATTARAMGVPESEIDRITAEYEARKTRHEPPEET